jgi:hypothetical protein
VGGWEGGGKGSRIENAVRVRRASGAIETERQRKGERVRGMEVDRVPHALSHCGQRKGTNGRVSGRMKRDLPSG